MEVRETCVMTFATSLDRQHRVRINDPRPSLAATNVNATASMLRAVDVFDGTIGRLESFVGAEVVTETTRTII
ncbi:MAG: DUF2922 domain-containing protein [Defluviitaleaceae bacterium]|nr:DUF2922 domain-containing protein [Defluviitaleaceae bacterium]